MMRTELALTSFLAGASAACERPVDRLHARVVSVCWSGRVFCVLLRSCEPSDESLGQGEVEIAAEFYCDAD